MRRMQQSKDQCVRLMGVPLVVQIEGFMYCNAQNRMRMRIYNCFNDIKVTLTASELVSSWLLIELSATNPLQTPPHPFRRAAAASPSLCKDCDPAA